MHSQVLAYKINIFFRVLFYLFNLYCLFRASGHAFREFSAYAYTVIAAGIQIRNKILENNPEGAGYGTGLAAGAAHLVTLDMAVTCPFKGIVITGIHARRFFAVPADCGKSSVFA
jgi:hypothetical protein